MTLTPREIEDLLDKGRADPFEGIAWWATVGRNNPLKRVGYLHGQLGLGYSLATLLKGEAHKQFTEGYWEGQIKFLEESSPKKPAPQTSTRTKLKMIRNETRARRG